MTLRAAAKQALSALEAVREIYTGGEGFVLQMCPDELKQDRMHKMCMTAAEPIEHLREALAEPEEVDARHEIEKLRLFASTLLDPDCYGHAVTAEVRDAARVVLGRKAVEVPNAKVTGSPALSASPCGLPGSAAD